MSQQNLDLRTSMQIVRRQKKLFGGVAIFGLLAGAVYAILSPLTLSSTALVVIGSNPASLSNQASTSTGGLDTSLATQVVIADSGPVLEGALPHVSPPGESLLALSDRVSVTAVGNSDILSFTATGKTPAEAEVTVNAVANSYVAYVATSTSNAVQVSARVLESATTATGTTLPKRIGTYAVLGALAGALVGFVICLVRSRGDRRLTRRDEIANSIAVPVLVSIPVERPADPPSWARLLNEYEPDAVHAYGLSKLLSQLGVADDGTSGHALSLTVLSLTSDPVALALGPQLAAFASARGIPTALVLGPQQDRNATAALHTVCSAVGQATAGHGKPLRLLVAEDGRVGQVPAALTIVVLVIDVRDPRVPPVGRTSATVLGVSAGGATAEELARAATAAAADGRDIFGILVANPDRDDQTTGRIPRLAPVRRALPTRVNGPAMEIKR